MSQRLSLLRLCAYGFLCGLCAGEERLSEVRNSRKRTCGPKQKVSGREHLAEKLDTNPTAEMSRLVHDLIGC
jgi:hypothetical protein